MTEAVAANRIRTIIERVERIEADEAALREDKNTPIGWLPWPSHPHEHKDAA